MALSRVLVTGASGFVGRALCRALLTRGYHVTALVRREGSAQEATREWCHGPSDFAGIGQAWPEDVVPDGVVHLAGRVHVMNETVADPGAAFRETNVAGTLRIARAAREHGARRFVFVSSVKAAGESDGGVPLSDTMPSRPLDAYGNSKLEAEEALLQYGLESGLEVAVVRPPLVYGPDVGANFLQLMNVVWRRMPLPLGSVNARRSMIYVENLADALVQCVTDPRAVNRRFYVRDDVDASVAGLLRSLGHYLGRPARIFPVPVPILRALGAVAGRSSQIDRLTQSLRVDDSSIRETLGWRPPHTLEEGLLATANWYRASHRNS